MPRVYLALAAAATDSEEVVAARAQITRDLHEMCTRQIRALEDLGFELLDDREA